MQDLSPGLEALDWVATAGGGRYTRDWQLDLNAWRAARSGGDA